MKQVLIIPADLRFFDLHLTRDPVTAELEFDTAPLRRIVESNNIDWQALGGEEAVPYVLTAWYDAHVKAAGATDPIMEQLRAEIEAEDAYGFAAVIEGTAGAH